MAAQGCSDVDSGITCAVCYGVFRTPKILPRCGHSACLDCIVQIVANNPSDNNLHCPECRTPSPLGHSGPHGLKTNVQLQRIIESAENQQAGYKDATNEQLSSGEVCFHVLLPKPRLTCPHCGAKFCHGCEAGHKERIKNEVLSMSKTIEENRRSHSCLASSDPLETARAHVEEQVENAENVIKHEMEALKLVISQSLDDQMARLVSSARALGNERWQELQKRMWLAQGQVPSGAFKVKTQSVLSISLEEMASVHKRMAEIVEKKNDFANFASSFTNYSLQLYQDRARVNELLHKLTSLKRHTSFSWTMENSDQQQNAVTGENPSLPIQIKYGLTKGPKRLQRSQLTSHQEKRSDSAAQLGNDNYAASDLRARAL